jgi:hypothetical protein
MKRSSVSRKRNVQVLSQSAALWSVAALHGFTVTGIKVAQWTC